MVFVMMGGEDSGDDGDDNDGLVSLLGCHYC